MKWMASPDVVWVDSAGEIRMYDTVAGEFQTLNLSAAAVWRQLVESGDQDAVVAALAEEFGARNDGDRELISGDVDRFIREIADLGLIVEQPSDAP